ncbi:mirror-image polydactyly gene 1 protein-like isoform X2 [Saccoglossus kowalevskii]
MAEKQTPTGLVADTLSPHILKSRSPRRSARSDKLTPAVQRKFDKIHAKVGETKETIADLRQRLESKDRNLRRETAMRRAAEKRQLDTSENRKSGQSYRQHPTPSPSEEDDLASLDGAEQAAVHRDGVGSSRNKRSHSDDRKKHSRDDEASSYTSDYSFTDGEFYSSEETPKSHGHRSRRKGHHSGRRHRRHSCDDPRDSRYLMPMPAPVFYYPKHYYNRGGPMHQTIPGPFHSPPEVSHMHDSRTWQNQSPNRSFPEGEFRPQGGPMESTQKSPATAECSPEKPHEKSTPSVNVIQVSDLETTLPFLVEELDAAKELNRKLSEQLMEAEKEIQSLKIAKSLSEVSNEAEINAKSAALIEELYRAAKVREEAVMARLRLANEERDEAILRLRRLEEARDATDSFTEIHSKDEDLNPVDTSLSELLCRLTKAEGSEDVDKYGHVIMSKIELTRDRKRRITSEEMRAILDERDVALAKCRKLEQELAFLRKTSEGTSSKNNNEMALRAQLQATQQERNVALAKARKLEDELQTLSVYYSLHKSLSQEQSLRDQFNNTLGSFEDEIKVRDEFLVKSQKDQNDLAAHLQQALAERNALMTQYQQSLQSQKEAAGKTEKLERLVNVLRKKLAEGTPKIVS